jgi:hypothetical protein
VPIFFQKPTSTARPPPWLGRRSAKPGNQPATGMVVRFDPLLDIARSTQAPGAWPRNPKPKNQTAGNKLIRCFEQRPPRVWQNFVLLRRCVLCVERARWQAASLPSGFRSPSVCSRLATRRPPPQPAPTTRRTSRRQHYSSYSFPPVFYALLALALVPWLESCPHRSFGLAPALVSFHHSGHAQCTPPLSTPPTQCCPRQCMRVVIHMVAEGAPQSCVVAYTHTASQSIS